MFSIHRVSRCILIYYIYPPLGTQISDSKLWLKETLSVEKLRLKVPRKMGTGSCPIFEVLEVKSASISGLSTQSTPTTLSQLDQSTPVMTRNPIVYLLLRVQYANGPDVSAPKTCRRVVFFTHHHQIDDASEPFALGPNALPGSRLGRRVGAVARGRGRGRFGSPGSLQGGARRLAGTEVSVTSGCGRGRREDVDSHVKK